MFRLSPLGLFHVIFCLCWNQGQGQIFCCFPKFCSLVPFVSFIFDTAVFCLFHRFAQAVTAYDLRVQGQDVTFPKMYVDVYIYYMYAITLNNLVGSNTKVLSFLLQEFQNGDFQCQS